MKEEVPVALQLFLLHHMILPNMDKEKAETWLASMGIDGTSPYNNITHGAGIFETLIR